MFKVGDLVQRVKVIESGSMSGSFQWILSDEYKDDIGIVIEVETPEYDSMLFDMTYPECFVKVKWQKNTAYGPIWHWGEELTVIKSKINT